MSMIATPPLITVAGDLLYYSHDHMNKPAPKNIELGLKIAILVMLVVLIALCALWVRQYRHLRRLDYFAAHPSLFAAIHDHKAATASDVSSIQSWMTFDYVNHLFALPSGYLQNDLGITDSRYPRLTIDEYAESIKTKQATVLTDVQSAVSAFLAPNQ